ADISRLLHEISERRAQAVALARAIDQSVFMPCSLSDNTSEEEEEEEEVGDLLDDSVNGGGSEEVSFLEDFTRDFVDLCYTPPGMQKIRDLLCQTDEEEEEEKAEDEEAEDDRGVSKIDYVARHRIWSRVGMPVSACGAEEARIVALVERAASLALNSEPQTLNEPSLTLNEPSLTLNSNHQISSDTSDSYTPLLPWAHNEWELWAAYTASSDATPALDWVHALQPGAWEHGFRDAQQGAKRVRTYSRLALALHAYADGNVKRTADVTLDGAKALATTLFFANGDWSCTLVGASAPRAYYYYCAEQVWHEQCAGRDVFRYADGRTCDSAEVISGN
ncbi:hypothetical protein GGF42_008982, partial [Coemansia sp. RSA 2424]